MQRAVLLDRDGVINKKAPEGQYVTSWEEVRILDGAAEAIALLNQTGFKVIVVSNQRCVAKGLISPRELEVLHCRISDELAAAGARIDRFYYCPHDYSDECSCRKPKPGMLLQAALENELELQNSWMVGDSNSDIQAGRNAGCLTALVAQGDHSGIYADLVASSLLKAAKLIIAADAANQPRRGVNASIPEQQLDSKHN